MENAWQQRLGVWWIAEAHPDQPAILHSPTGEELTFAELAGRAHQLVHGLRRLGLRAGDIVAYALLNGVDIVVWQLAAQESGLRSIALNPALSSAEIRAIVDHAEAVAVAIHAELADRVAQLVDAPSIKHKIAVGGPVEGFVEQAEVVDGQPRSSPPDRRLGAAIAYSSGTTGKPKAVWRDVPAVDPSEFADAMKSFGHAFRFRPLHGAHLVSAGMHHGGCQGFYQGALNVGQGLVIMGKFDAEQSLALIERHRVTTAYMVPTQFVRLLRLPPEVREHYDHSSLKSVVHSAAPCPLEIKKQMFDWWGPVIWETYGGMEGAATIAKPQHWLAKPGTVGRAIRGMKVRILDDDGAPLPPGEVGHVYLESAGPVFEYKGEPDLTRSVHRDRAFTIGDMGSVDEEGFLFLCDRAKDLIISGGVNIYPAEVEGVLSAHPQVGDAAVIGVPDPEWGEQVKAVVEVVAGVEPTEVLADELLAWCRERLASYKCPRTVDFRDQLPRTDGGKLYKRHLRDEYWATTGRRR
ncbi:MAG: AMP-binding protein [Acidimicrobiales bacterium]